MENDFEENLTKNDTLEEDCNCSFFFYTLFALKGVTHTTQVIATISEIKTPCVGKAVKNKSLMN